MGETGGHGVERCKSKRVIKAIVYGNTASYLGKKLENDHTHEWTVFVRPYHNEDPAKFIRKVQFKLHDSYANPTRGKFIYRGCKHLSPLCLLSELFRKREFTLQIAFIK